ncbi:MAG: polysaccharide biosynthesis C-terminal domain-containing protein [Acholeplasmatales bacterium]|nr:polysaccharide biosynthesis C-terminal domain-containing protein [Acholeplasmatales bacterium]
MEDLVKKRFKENVIPALFVSVVLGTFAIIDGLFIGNKIGDIGLAAINFAWPITAFIQSVGFGVGLGGAILISISLGKQDGSEKKYLFNTYLLLIISSVIMMLIFLFTSKPLLAFFGASGATLDLGYEYIENIIYFTIFQVLAQGLAPIIRNFGYNKYTMFSMCFGFVVNLILDWLFIMVWDMSLFGAALATNLAQASTALLIIGMLCRKKHWPDIKFSFRQMKEILITGLSPFGNMMAPNIVLILINKSISIYSNDAAVAAYTAIAYVAFIVCRLFNGVADGAQPLMSYYYGSNDKKSKNAVLNYSIILSFALMVVSTAAVIIFKNQLQYVFGLSDEGKEIFKQLLYYFAFSFVFMQIMQIAKAYFYSQKKDLYASVIVYLEPLIVGLVVFTFPMFMGLDGIWVSTPISQGILAVISIVFIAILIKNDNKEEEVL